MCPPGPEPHNTPLRGRPLSYLVLACNFIMDALATINLLICLVAYRGSQLLIFGCPQLPQRIIHAPTRSRHTIATRDPSGHYRRHCLCLVTRYARGSRLPPWITCTIVPRYRLHFPPYYGLLARTFFQSHQGFLEFPRLPRLPRLPRVRRYFRRPRILI